MDKKVICPNCGAPNESTFDTCQFCGASLAEVEINQLEESEVDYSVEKVKGKPQIKFDKRIFKLKYDEIEDEAELCLSDNITSTIVGCYYFRYNFTDDCLILYSVKTVISGGKKYNFEYTNTWSCPVIKKDNLGLLEKFCNLNLKNCRVDGFLKGEEFLFVLICRTYYNTIFDHSKYTDAADKLFRYIEERGQKDAENCKKENRNQLMIALIFFGGLFLLGLIIKLIQGTL